jgi:hypothetical protein
VPGLTVGKKMNKRILLVIPLLLLAACSPSIEIAVIESEKEQVFEFDIENAMGLGQLGIWDPEDKEWLWQVQLNYFRDHKLSYGEIPKGFTTQNGGINNARQIYPKKDVKPKELPPNKNLLMSVTMLYDFIGRSSTTRFFRLQTDSTGKIDSIDHTTSLGTHEFPGAN